MPLLLTAHCLPLTFLLLRLRLELDAAVFDGDGEVDALAAGALLQSLRLLGDHAVEAREGEVIGRLATFLAGLDEGVEEAAHGAHVAARVGADEGGWLRFRLGRGLRRGSAPAHAAPLLALLHRAAPELHEGGEARGQGVVVVALREAERALVGEALDESLDA